VVVSNAKAHGDAALADHRPERGERVLDIGCGLETRPSSSRSWPVPRGTPAAWM